MSPSPAFHDAAAYLSSSSPASQVSSSVKLELYGLFKYLTVSKAPVTSRPSIFDMTNRAKWDAWSSISKKYQQSEGAERRYLQIAGELGWVEGKVVVPEVSEVRASGDDDIWDDDSVPSSSRGGEGGMGLSVSSMAPPPKLNDSSVHGLTIEGDINSLSKLLRDNPGTDLNQLDEYGYTPLHLACDRGHIEIVKLLLAKGADVTIKDPDDLTSLELAQVTGNTEIIYLLSSSP